MSKQEETVEVKVKVPKHLMDLLEKRNYFGWGKERFFMAAVRTGISAEVCELDIDEIKQLEAEYGEQLGCWGLRLDFIPEDLKSKVTL